MYNTGITKDEMLSPTHLCNYSNCEKDFLDQSVLNDFKQQFKNIRYNLFWKCG